MAIKIPLVITENRDLNLFQTQLSKALQPVTTNPINQGSLLTGIAVINGQVTVNHGLGRTLMGYIVTLNNSNVNLWDSQESNPSPAQTLLLNADGNSVISLWVF